MQEFSREESILKRVGAYYREDARISFGVNDSRKALDSLLAAYMVYKMTGDKEMCELAAEEMKGCLNRHYYGNTRIYEDVIARTGEEVK